MKILGKIYYKNDLYNQAIWCGKTDVPLSTLKKPFIRTLFTLPYAGIAKLELNWFRVFKSRSKLVKRNCLRQK